MFHPRLSWSSDNVILLRRRWEDGDKVKDIASSFEISQGAVRQKLIALGLYRRKKMFAPIKLSPEEAAYLAGIIDGEGHISFNVAWKNGQPWRAVASVQVSNSRRELLDWIKSKIVTTGFWKAAHVLYAKSEGRYQSKAVDHFHLGVTGEGRVVPLLRAIAPYVILKKEQVRSVLAFYETHPKGRTPLAVNEVDLIYKCRKATGSRKKPHERSLQNLARALARLKRDGNFQIARSPWGTV